MRRGAAARACAAGAHVSRKAHMSTARRTCHPQGAHVTRKAHMSTARRTCRPQGAHVSRKAHMSAARRTCQPQGVHVTRKAHMSPASAAGARRGAAGCAGQTQGVTLRAQDLRGRNGRGRGSRGDSSVRGCKGCERHHHRTQSSSDSRCGSSNVRNRYLQRRSRAQLLKRAGRRVKMR